MNSLFSPESIPSRKVQLQTQLSDALDRNDQELLFFLEGKWVHRYGFKSLSDCKTQAEDSLIKESCLMEPLVNEDYSEVVTSVEENNFISTPLEGMDNNESLALREESTHSPIPLNLSRSDKKLDVNLESEASPQINESEPEDSDVIMPPPPPPSISHLRRWLPSIAEKISKAS